MAGHRLSQAQNTGFRCGRSVLAAYNSFLWQVSKVDPREYTTLKGAVRPLLAVFPCRALLYSMHNKLSHRYHGAQMISARNRCADHRDGHRLFAFHFGTRIGKGRYLTSPTAPVTI